MARSLGTESYLGISTDGGTVYTEIEHITSISTSLSIDLVENTSNDDAGWKSNLAGNKQQTLEFECMYDYASGQKTVRTAARAGTLAYWKYRPAVATGEVEYILQGRVSEVSGESPNNDNNTTSFSVESSGSVTEQAQS